MTEPRTRYAKSGSVNIAYQAIGDGPPDLVFVPGWVSHVEHGWEEPSYAPFLERLTRFARLVILDRRGTGLSDPVDRLPTLEERMDDVRAVMDAVGVERAYLIGISEGGAMCTLFAATHPERTAGLILCNTFACGTRSEDYPWAPTPEMWDQLLAAIDQGWGKGLTPFLFAPSRAAEREFRRAWGRFERLSVSPGAMQRLMRIAIATDVRDVLPAVRVPTLVLHRRDDQAIPVGHGRYLAEHIPGARWVELPGADHFLWIGDTGPVLDEIESFVTGGLRASEPDRVLATVLFVDLVDSTGHLARLGDRRWRELLERVFGIVEEQLERHRGREIDRAGDGLLAAFDGPARAMRCARAIREGVAALGLEIRAGIHTGECEVVGGKLGGIAVHLGARVSSTAAPGEILVSGTVKDLVAGSELRFSDRGTHALRGIPGEWRLYAIDDKDVVRARGA